MKSKAFSRAEVGAEMLGVRGSRQGLGFRALGSGVQGFGVLGFRVFWFKVLGFRALGSKVWGLRLQNEGFREAFIQIAPWALNPKKIVVTTRTIRGS